MSERPQVLTVTQFAKLAQLSRSHVYDLVKSGDVPSVAFGQAIRIPAKWAYEKFDGKVPDAEAD